MPNVNNSNGYSTPYFTLGEIKVKVFFKIMCVMLLSAVLNACGQQGPLYLPADEKPAAEVAQIGK